MKHAFLIITHGNEQITSKFIKLYDDIDIDFYILVDSKTKNYDFKYVYNSKKNSNIFFLHNIKVYWGDFSLVKAELELLKESTKKEYDYYHLISGCDFPLFSKKEYLKYFNQNKNIEYIDFVDETLFLERVKYFHFFMKYIRSNPLFSKISLLSIKIQKILNINRIRKFDNRIKCGSQWFDITHDFALYLLNNERWINETFKFTNCADEMFLQSVLYNSPFYENNYLNFKSSIIKPRYIDWKRGSPHTFLEKDINELIGIQTSFFARKFDYNENNKVIDDLYEYLDKSE